MSIANCINIISYSILVYRGGHSDQFDSNQTELKTYFMFDLVWDKAWNPFEFKTQNQSVAQVYVSEKKLQTAYWFEVASCLLHLALMHASHVCLNQWAYIKWRIEGLSSSKFNQSRAIEWKKAINKKKKEIKKGRECEGEEKVIRKLWELKSDC